MLDGMIGQILACEDCGHAIGRHMGSGCDLHGCGCVGTKEAVLERNIVAAIQERAAEFAVAPHDALHDSAVGREATSR